jgi:hypothetical protein
MLMTEHYIVIEEPSVSNSDVYKYVNGYVYPTYEKAELHSKRQAANKGNNYLILKSYATAKAVVPQIEVVKH